MYKFDKTLDAIGLPAESLYYVKKNCKQCYGRGKVEFLEGNGYTTSSSKEKIKNQKKIEWPCVCLNKGYVRLRKSLEELADKMVEVKSIERKEALKIVVENFLKNNDSVL